MGLIDIREVTELLEDLDGLPSFMGMNDDSPIDFEDHDTAMALWYGTGNVDSGLHYDDNAGGFVALIAGRKHVLLFPPGDQHKLYMRTEPGHVMESKLFLAEMLGDQ